MSIIQGTAHSGGQYQIERSLRFNSADTAYLSRTPASAGNRRTWTWSGWVKRGDLGSNQCLIKSGTSAYVFVFFDTSNKLNVEINNGATNYNLITTQVFRDPSAWGMLTIAVDTTQATASNRTKIYWNGVQITAFGTANYITQNYDTEWNNTTAHYIGSNGGVNYHLSAYQTELHNIDGQALTPSSFGETDASTGVWKPKRYTGTYGTNGFFLKFADNSGTTSTTLGKDSSGNGNNWTPNNFSVTAGAGNDSLVDTPTLYGSDTGVGGEVRGNYCTLNPLDQNASGVTLSNGNLQIATSSSNVGAYATMGVSTGKWYFEFTRLDANGTPAVGVAPPGWARTYPGVSGGGVGYHANGIIYNNGTQVQTGLATYTTNDVIGVALNLDSGSVTFYKNNTQVGTTVTGLTGEWFPAVSGQVSSTSVVNFGQRPFAYTAPSGFKALCTQNLPTPTIGATSTTQAGKYFNTVLYTGNGTSRSITGLGFQPDLLWFKARSQAYQHGLFDSVRGNTKVLQSALTNAEATYTDEVTSFDSDGFSLGASAAGYTNYGPTTPTMVSWAWKANGAGSTNTSGTITSTVSANTTSGFSIVTYTGTSANATVGHGLGVAPKMVIQKNRTDANGWRVWHTAIANSEVLYLNATNAKTTETAAWNSTSPTSTVFSVGTSGDTNGLNDLNVAYCFAEVAGYSKFGSYTGNGSADGPFVFCGFRPRYVLIKVSSGTTGSWVVWDTARSTYNATGLYLVPNLSNAEAGPGIIDIDILSNGFKIRQVDGTYNANTATYIYAAFAESPFKYSLAR